jgi:hypothetical protein
VNLNGNAFTSCCYKDAEGVRACDIYLNGVYQGNIPNKAGTAATVGLPTGPERADPDPTRTRSTPKPRRGKGPPTRRAVTKDAEGQICCDYYQDEVYTGTNAPNRLTH